MEMQRDVVAGQMVLGIGRLVLWDICTFCEDVLL